MTEVDTRIDTLPDFENASRGEIVDFFKKDPHYGKYYSFDSGVWQNYTLEEHTLMMMRQFDRYFARDFGSPLLSIGQFRVMLALHDLGKPKAVELWGKEDGRKRQGEVTEELIPEALKHLDFDEKTKALITAVPTRDLMGALLKKHTNPEKQAKAIKEGRVIKPDEAARRVTEIGEEIGVNPKDLFELYYTYFLSDASSYTHDADSEMPPPPEPKYEDLDHLFIFERKPGEENGFMRLIPELEERVKKTRELLIAS